MTLKESNNTTDTKPVFVSLEAERAFCCEPWSQSQAHSLLFSKGDTGTYWKTSLYLGWRWLEERQIPLIYEKWAGFEKGWTVLVTAQQSCRASHRKWPLGGPPANVGSCPEKKLVPTLPSERLLLFKTVLRGVFGQEEILAKSQNIKSSV